MNLSLMIIQDFTIIIHPSKPIKIMIPLSRLFKISMFINKHSNKKTQIFKKPSKFRNQDFRKLKMILFKLKEIKLHKIIMQLIQHGLIPKNRLKENINNQHIQSNKAKL